MDDYLHVYRREDLAEAVLEDKLTGACGADLEPPITQGGIPIRPASRSRAICLDCLEAIGPDRALSILQRQQSKVKEGAQ
ncbi:hypothetical protein [Nesterenkonia sp. CF4.4]|uniref:hypothetical protein n=1 Tax=Nesterenkonia sp. CF4.4 TaxID=3373079 RepID=UPI003EE71C37